MTLETIVNNMISAGEPESNIAMVIKAFKKINKNKKSPLKQTEEECPEGFEKNDAGECAKIEEKYGRSIEERGERSVSSAEVEAMKAYEKEQREKQAQEDAKRQEYIESEETNLEEYPEDPEIKVEDEVIVEAPSRETEDKSVYGEEGDNGADIVIDEIEQSVAKPTTQRKQVGYSSTGMPIYETVEIAEEDQEYNPVDIANAYNLGDEANKDQSTGELIVEAYKKDPVLNTFMSKVLDGSQDIVDKEKIKIFEKYNINVDRQNQIIEDYRNNNIVEYNKNIGDIVNKYNLGEWKDGTLFIADGATNDPDWLARQQAAEQEINNYIKNFEAIAIGQDLELISDFNKANSDFQDFQIDLVDKASKSSKVYKDRVKDIQETILGKVEEVNEDYLQAIYGSEGWRELTKSIKEVIPQQWTDAGVLFDFDNIQELEEEIEKVKSLKPLYSEGHKKYDPEVFQYINRGGGAILIGPEHKYKTKEELIAKLQKEQGEEYKEGIEKMVKSQKFQNNIDKFKKIEFFDQDGITFNDVVGSTLEQVPQMVAALVTLGGHTFMAEAGAIAKESLNNQAALEWANATGEDPKNFYNLPLEERSAYMYELVKNGGGELDKAFEGGLINAGIDMIGNFVVLGGVKVPLDVVRKSWKMFFNQNLKKIAGQTLQSAWKTAVPLASEVTAETTQEIVSAIQGDAALENYLLKTPSEWDADFKEVTSPDGKKRIIADKTTLFDKFLATVSDPQMQKDLMEVATKTLFSTGGILSVGRLGTTSFDQFLKTTIPYMESGVIAVDKYESVVKAAYDAKVQKIRENTKLTEAQKRTKIQEASTVALEKMAAIKKANELISNNALRGLDANKKYEVIKALVRQDQQKVKLEGLEERAKIYEDQNKDIPITLQNQIDATQNQINKSQEKVYLQRGLQLMEEDATRTVDLINNSKVKSLKNKKVSLVNTKKQAETIINKKKEEIQNSDLSNEDKAIQLAQLENDNITGLLDGKVNGVVVDNEAIIVKDNIVKNTKLDDLSPTNTINHEVNHFIYENATKEELKAIQEQVTKDIKDSKDPVMQKALDYANKKIALTYAKDIKKDKSGRVEGLEFMAALSDGMRHYKIKDLSLENQSLFGKIANVLNGQLNETTQGEIKFDFDPKNAFEFIKQFNNVRSDKVDYSILDTKIDVEDKPTLASKTVLESINELVPSSVETKEDFQKPKVFNKVYESLKNPDGAINNYIRSRAESKEEGDKIIDNVTDRLIKFDPNAKRADGSPVGIEGLGEFIFANTRFGKLGAKRDLFKEGEKRKREKSIDDKDKQILDTTQPTFDIEGAVLKELGLSKKFNKNAEKAMPLAIIAAEKEIAAKQKAVGKDLTQKQRQAAVSRGVTKILKRDIEKPLKAALKKNKNISKDYINKKWKSVAEAFVAGKNLNMIRTSPETKALLKKWQDGNITKEEVLNYFNDPNVAANTLSDRRNVALVNAIMAEFKTEAIKDYKKQYPDQVTQFEQDNKVILASKALNTELSELFGYTDYRPNSGDIITSGPNKGIHKNAVQYITDIKEIVGLNEFPPGLLNKSHFQLRKMFPKKDGKRHPSYDYISKELDKIDFGKHDGRYSKTKPGDLIDGLNTFGNLEKFNKSKNENFWVDYNKRNGEMFNDGWNAINNILSKNKELGSAIYWMLNTATGERNHFHPLGAEVISYNKNAKKGDKIEWEHAVQSTFAAKFLLSAALDNNVNFKDALKALKKNYKVIALSKAENNLITKAGFKDLMPAVEGRPFDIYKDSWKERYLQTPGLDLTDQTSLINKSNPFKGKPVLASKVLSDEFNKMLERTEGVKFDAIYSPARANKIGVKKGFKIFVPYSAEDFLGLIYPTLGKGKQGDADLQWWKDNVMDPYNNGMMAFETAKQAAMLDWKELKSKIKNTPANLKKDAVRDFNNEDAVRVYLWNEQNMLPDGLAQKDVTALVKHVNNSPELKKFADGLRTLNLEGYPAPNPGWQAGTITTDLVNHVNTVVRSEYLQPWQQAVDAIYTPDNLNKLKATYGNSYVEALEDSLYRMKTGRNRPAGSNRLTNTWLNWVNDSVGTIMFFNQRSALLQTISSINFLNWTDNNPISAAKAFANQPQFWSDFVYLFNSDFLKQRRSGLKTDVNADDIARSAATSPNKARAAASYLLKIGFLPTQIADSFAISIGGASFYRNRFNSYRKQGLSKKEAQEKAFADFRNSAQESQQSSDPSRISMQQAGPLGRLILAFANTPIQYTRLTKRAIQDLKNGRGDWKTNVSKIVYYGAVQNIIFTALQQAMFGILFDDEDEEKGKKETEFRKEQKEKSLFNVANSTADTFLRGSGVGGAFIAMLKNMALEAVRQSDKSRPDYERVADKLFSFSPVIDSKFRKLQSSGRTFTYKQELKKIQEKGFAVDNPAFMAIAQTISAFTNVPLDRVLKKMKNIKTATEEETKLWQQIALLMGYGEWELGIQARKTDEARKKAEKEKAEQKKFKNLQKDIDKGTKKKSPVKALQHGVLGRANRDGTIEVAPGLSPKKRAEVIRHEKLHQKEMKSGKLDYDDSFVYYGKKKFERKNGMIAHAGKWKKDGDHSLPWEKFAHKHD